MSTGIITNSLDPELELKAINTIRLLAADGVQAAKSGHPGMPMGMAPAAFTLLGEKLWPGKRERRVAASPLHSA